MTGVGTNPPDSESWYRWGLVAKYTNKIPCANDYIVGLNAFSKAIS
jgi:hypothetical protein